MCVLGREGDYNKIYVTNRRKDLYISMCIHQLENSVYLACICHEIHSQAVYMLHEFFRSGRRWHAAEILGHNSSNMRSGHGGSRDGVNSSMQPQRCDANSLVCEHMENSGQQDINSGN